MEYDWNTLPASKDVSPADYTHQAGTNQPVAMLIRDGSLGSPGRGHQPTISIASSDSIILSSDDESVPSKNGNSLPNKTESSLPDNVACSVPNKSGGNSSPVNPVYCSRGFIKAGDSLIKNLKSSDRPSHDSVSLEVPCREADTVNNQSDESIHRKRFRHFGCSQRIRMPLFVSPGQAKKAVTVVTSYAAYLEWLKTLPAQPESLPPPSEESKRVPVTEEQGDHDYTGQSSCATPEKASEVSGAVSEVTCRRSGRKVQKRRYDDVYEDTENLPLAMSPIKVVAVHRKAVPVVQAPKTTPRMLSLLSGSCYHPDTVFPQCATSTSVPESGISVAARKSVPGLQPKKRNTSELPVTTSLSYQADPVSCSSKNDKRQLVAAGSLPQIAPGKGSVDRMGAAVAANNGELGCLLVFDDIANSAMTAGTTTHPAQHALVKVKDKLLLKRVTDPTVASSSLSSAEDVERRGQSGVPQDFFMVRNGLAVNLFELTAEVMEPMRQGKLTVMPQSALCEKTGEKNSGATSEKCGSAEISSTSSNSSHPTGTSNKGRGNNPLAFLDSEDSDVNIDSDGDMEQTDNSVAVRSNWDGGTSSLEGSAAGEVLCIDRSSSFSCRLPGRNANKVLHHKKQNKRGGIAIILETTVVSGYEVAVACIDEQSYPAPSSRVFKREQRIFELETTRKHYLLRQELAARESRLEMIRKTYGC